MKKTYAWVFLVLLVVYIVLAFGLPTDPKVLERFNFSQTDARLLNVTVVGPLVAIYLTALYGFVRFKRYAGSVRQSNEGPHLRKLGRGLMVLAYSLPINSIVGALVTYTSWQQPELAKGLSALRTYIVLVVSFTAIYYIAVGVQGLYDTVSKKVKPSILPNYIDLLVPIALASTFTWLLMLRSGGGDSAGAYHLPDWLIITTLIIPYVVAWTLGIRAAVRLYAYQKLVKGVIYKRGLKYISWGVGVLIAVSVLLQFLTAISERLDRLNLTPLLTIIYFLLISYAVGYGLLARGSKRLKQIEEA